MEEMGKMKIKTDDEKEFEYSIDENPDISGYGLGICPITEEIKSDLKIIKDVDITEMTLSKKEMNDSYCCNIGREDLIGKYYDKNGFIYYELDNNISRFFLKINYFKKLYKSKIKGH